MSKYFYIKPIDKYYQSIYQRYNYHVLKIVPKWITINKKIIVPSLYAPWIDMKEHMEDFINGHPDYYFRSIYEMFGDELTYYKKYIIVKL